MNRKFSIEEAQDLLRRYRLGECTESERQIVDLWYQSLSAGEVDQSERLDDLKAQMLDSINHKIDEVSGEQSSTPAQSGGGKTLPLVTFAVLRRIAAILVVGTAVGIFFYEHYYDSPGDGSRLSAAAGEEIRVGESNAPSTLYLADGTVVWLKAGSTLQFPETFEGDVREVALTGEAFFDVAKNPEKPFVIHSANFTTRVLGTTFNVRAYGNEESQEVVVVTGRVVVSVNKPSSANVSEVVLHPNQKVVYSARNNSLVEYPVAESATSVAAGKQKLAFDETRLEDIIKVLDAAFGVNISVSEERMNRCVITADLTGETLAVDLEILSRAMNGTYTMTGGDIVLHGSGCGASE